MNVDEAISGRRSVREYTTQGVDEHTIRHLINAAILAPSAVNQQPWTFTVVRDQGLLDRISRDAKAHMLVTMPESPQSDHFRSLLNDPNFQIFYHAPVLILISAEAHGPWIVEDCALAAENLMLAACGYRLRRSSSVIRRTYHRRSAGRSREFAGSANRYLLSSYGRELVAVQ
jgi:nitroreductase